MAAQMVRIIGRPCAAPIFPALLRLVGVVWPEIPVSYILGDRRCGAFHREAVLPQDHRIIGTRNHAPGHVIEPPETGICDKTFSIGPSREPMEWMNSLE